MATTEEIITRYSANEGDYVRGTEKAIGATKKLAKAVGVTQDKIARGRFTSSQGQNGFFGKFFKDLKGMKMSAVEMPGFDDFANLGRMAIGTLAGVATAAGVAGIAAMRKAGDFDALVLQSVQ